MLISVIIPVYCAENTIKNCVASVLKNIPEHAEIILVNDGSVDASSKICDELAAQHSCVSVLHKRNQGVAAARNDGVSMAHGEYIMFLDADDQFTSEAWKKIIDLIDKGAEFTAFSYYTWFGGDKLVPERFNDSNQLITDDDSINKILLGTPLLHTCWGKLFRREIIEHHNIKFPLGLAIGEDYIFVMEYLKYAESKILSNECLLKYYQNANGAMGSFDYDKRLSGIRAVWSYCNDYTSSDLMCKYRDVMCEYQFYSALYIARSLAVDGSIGSKLAMMRKFLRDKTIEDITNHVPYKRLKSYRKLEYFMIKHNLAFASLSYFKLKARLMKHI